VSGVTLVAGVLVVALLVYLGWALFTAEDL
jgi:hypothetical protein